MKKILSILLLAPALVFGQSNHYNILDNTSATISGGTIDNTVIGGTTPASITGTTVTANTSITNKGNYTALGTGLFFLADFSNATVANRFYFKTSTTNGNANVGLLPDGTGNFASWNAYGGSDPSNNAFISLHADTAGTHVGLNSSKTGAGTLLPLDFQISGSTKVRLFTNGNFAIGSTSDNGNLLQVNDSVSIAGSLTGLTSLGFTSTTFSGLPSASSNSGKMAYVSNIGAAGSYWVSDGSVWRPMNGSVTIASTSIPLILPSSGTIGNNGALSGLTALPTTYANCYMYFPANAISAGSAAGMYFVQMSSTTAGTIYNNTYTSGNPTIPASPTPFSTTGPGAYTQTTGSFITVFSYTVPGNAMGLNGELRIEPAVQFPNNGNTKTSAYFLGSTALWSGGRTTAVSDEPLIVLRNRGVAGTQFLPYDPNSNYGTNQASAGVIKSINTANDNAVSAQLQLGVATDYMILDTIVVGLRSQ